MTSAPASTVMQTPFGTLDLARYPSRAHEDLLAWCSADALLLDDIHRRGVYRSRMLVVNDAYGALCAALEPYALWTDSALAVFAMQRNVQANQRAAPRVLWSTQSPPDNLEQVVMRVPKLRPFFEYQLSQLARSLPAGTTVLAAGMDKHLSPHTATLLEHWIGPTERLRGQRKARLFRAVRDSRPAADFQSTARYFCEPLGASLQGMPNVFSREQLDGGTRFLLQHLSGVPAVERGIDLACGNGVLGLFAAKHGLARTMTFCDESAMALASARANAEQVLPGCGDRFRYHHGDGLQHFGDAPVQLILCNPPFHEEHTVNEFAGRHLLSRCSEHLQSGGRLYLVSNRHLDYLPVLKHQFRRAEKCEGNARFTIYMAQKE